MKPNLPAAILIATLAGTTQTLAFDLPCLNSTPAFTGFTLTAFGPQRTGFSVSSAGDVNGDGIDDVIIGAPDTDPNGLPSAGQTHVVFGGANVGASGLFDLAQLNGANGFALNGVDIIDRSGTSVSSAGDVNGDGFDDIIIGAPYASVSPSDAGESYVLFGGAAVGGTGVIELSSLNGANGFKLTGVRMNDKSGDDVSSAGDINGDGFDDLLIGAGFGDTDSHFDAGVTYVVFGGANVGTEGLEDEGIIPLSSLNGANGFALNGINNRYYTGLSVAGAGDVNADGFDDIIIGASGGDPNGGGVIEDSGESYVVFGGANVGSMGSFELSSLNGANGFVVNGANARDYSGNSVSSAGDFNGDGVDDFLITTRRGSDPIGAAYVVYGGSNVGSTGAINLSSLNGANGFAVTGSTSLENNPGLITNASSAGDINADGFDDIIVGDPNADPTPGSNTGSSYVIFGGPSVGGSGVFDLSSLNGINGFIVNGFAFADAFGGAVSSAGDFNNDGIDDLIIGALGASPPMILDSNGASYVIFGSPTLGQPAPADLNANGCVNSADLAVLLAAWGTPDADINSDGTTNSADLAILLAAWSG